MVVCGADGLDEISCSGDTWAWSLTPDGNIVETVLHPTQFGLGIHPLTAVAGGTASENAATLTRLLTSGKEVPEELRPVLEFVLLNAAALLVVAGVAGDFKDGVRLARESIASGAAWNALEMFREAGRMSMTGITT
jgi:anthranilate phosphoribosyltransferase